MLEPQEPVEFSFRYSEVHEIAAIYTYIHVSISISLSIYIYIAVNFENGASALLKHAVLLSLSVWGEPV